jgi:hypothetical protein
MMIMIRTLTIIEHLNDGQLPEYTLNGNLPLEEAARALVIAAANLPKTEQEKG